MTNRLKKHRSQIIIALIFIGFVVVPAGSPSRAESSSPMLGFHIGDGDAAHMAAVQAAGGGFAVKVFNWANIEPEPNYLYWEVPDAALRAAEFHDVQLVARLDHPPAWARDDDGPTPWQLEAYSNFVRRVVERYGDRLAGIIIWNEPNLTLEWNDQRPDPAAYVEMLKAAYPAAKAANPDLPVLLAGLAFTTNSDTSFDDLEYLRQIYEAGGGAYFDILAAHPYGFGQPPASAPNPSQLNFRRLELHRDLMEANGDADKPVWITEMGWRTRAPDPGDAWQVVTPLQQADYSQEAIAYAARSYPWLERMAFWKVHAAGDIYGFDLWQGPQQTSLAYQTLVDTCSSRSFTCDETPAERQPSTSELSSEVSILAPDVIIRLGDRGTLHPHWVHLHRGGQNFSPDWQTEFFVSAAQAQRDYNLQLEVMQIDQPTNRLFVNEVELAYLKTRTRPDPTSTWVTQEVQLPPELLQPGLNTFSLVVGQRNPARQYSFWRWENTQLRNVRLVPRQPEPAPLIEIWTPQPTPSGWSEAIRLRPGLGQEFWLTGNRRGEIWRGQAGSAPLELQAGNRPDLLFTDILPTGQGELAATDQGLFWRARNDADWTSISGAPGTYAYVVAEAAGRFYAGFEAAGLWRAPHPAGPWRADEPELGTVLDLVFDPASETLFAATEDGIFSQAEAGAAWQRLPALPGESENPLMGFTTRLFLGNNGELVARNLDRLWRWREGDDTTESPGEWTPFGPKQFSETNKIYAVLNCCDPGAIVSTRFMGLWQLTGDETWQRLDVDNTFTVTDATELLAVGDDLYAAGLLGLFQSSDGGERWQKVGGLPPVVTDLLVDPADPSRWVAGTPAGVYLSENGGRAWEPISPPWTVWDMALGADSRLFVAPTSGVASTDSLAANPVSWQEAEGLSDVLFFSVNPHPTDSEVLWAGTWGNDIGVSDDGGQTVVSLGNGLQTLSVLDILRHPTPGQVTVGTIEGLYRTDDGGESWFQLPGPLTRQTIYNLLQTGDGSIWAGAADGLWISADYGVTWNRARGMPTATVLRLGEFSDSTGKRWLWAGTEYDGLWLSADGGASWRFGGLAEHSIYNLFLDQNETDRLVVATDRGILAASLERLRN